MTTTTRTRPGRGWVGFAAILLMVAGTMQFLDGLWAIRTQDTAVDALFWNNNLEAWGWLYLILGVGLLVTGTSSSSGRPGPSESASSSAASARC